ncbi:Up-regulated during septation-domain-containing protein [Dactylonectria macrodidyma]|uniref:Up-regulated during septation-domain-containing protein n=1 Tax=Dactylonectria macrodidyma TaxID=307937 RepID=A0A9P9DHJ5_9HYPO|nr:Up-regulated during septation-domain-containing protein [Dactylonectria macrodidyma]
MQHPDPPRKYQLFPTERRLLVLNSSTKAVDIENAVPTSSVPTSDKTDKQLAPNGLKKRLNQHSLVQRRKISVSGIGPMTTVQELAMDSPTIPGRPPFHERSISAPGTSFRKHQLTDTFLYISSDDEGPEPRSACQEAPQAYRQGIAPISPKHFTPLVIPKSDARLPLLRHQQSLNCFPAGNDSLRYGRFDGSPRRRTAFTLNSSMPDITTPKSASTKATSCDTLPTPVSAPPMESRTASPKPWDGRYTPPIIRTEANSAFRGHRKGGSESLGIMDRGRLRKSPDLRTNNGPIIQRTEPKRGKSSEQKALEQLPTGLKQADASEQLEQSELALLQKQAFDQVGRFEVLKAADVETVSKELRHLDERTEYLRRTYNALRVGRRNLHSRIFQYLRSPRVAKFSHESMMKQKEALAELDASIDDWVNKLEQAEDRRTRVRQKLLEHVAAAACLTVGGLTTTLEPPQQPQANTPASGISNISTPPRSHLEETFTSAGTASSSPSPQRVVAQAPSTVVEQPVIEEAATRETEERVMSTAFLKRADVESIRIYAGDDVYALLADVKNEITRMSNHANEPTSTADMIETIRIAHHRQRSHDMLKGISAESHLVRRMDHPDTRVYYPLAPPPTTKENEPAEDDIPLLANVVYRP